MWSNLANLVTNTSSVVSSLTKSSLARRSRLWKRSLSHDVVWIGSLTSWDSSQGYETISSQQLSSSSLDYHVVKRIQQYWLPTITTYQKLNGVASESYGSVLLHSLQALTLTWLVIQKLFCRLMSSRPNPSNQEIQAGFSMPPMIMSWQLCFRMIAVLGLGHRRYKLSFTISAWKS